MEGKVTVKFRDGKEQMYPVGTMLLSIARQEEASAEFPIVAAKVDNDLHDLQSRLETDCMIEFVRLNSDEGMKVYQRSLTFVMIAAVHEVFSAGKITVEHSLSKGLYCELHVERDITKQDIEKIKVRMTELIKQQIPIQRQVYPTEEAIQLFAAAGETEKVKLLKQLKREKVSIYYLGNLFDYFYGTMVPNTSYLNCFDITFYPPGFILQFPEKDSPTKLPEFVVQPKLARVFREAEVWAEIMECDYVAKLNEMVYTGKSAELIRIAEALHEKKIAQIADYIAQHRKEVRIILVAGPSSSGKTTFAQRLNIQLRVNGVRPVPISLDDYFVDRTKTPRNTDGTVDFESIEAIDLKLFNEHLTRLLEGERVELPIFDFAAGQRVYTGNSVSVLKDQPLIIEGIHGLNERLTRAVPREQKVKIYISALTQLSIDSHNRIPTTDTRLLRRIVRDNQFRAHDALNTLRLWPAVRSGEDQNIFPFQEEADIMFNSALLYELGVLKKYAQPLLQQVAYTDPEYSEAKRLLNFLEYFENIEEAEVSPNSILREFIGKSCFYA